MTNSTEAFAIKTGTRYTLVLVNHIDNQCQVWLDPRLKTGGLRTLTVSGTSDRVIQRAAMDGSGRSYKTLKDLRAEADKAVIASVQRRYDLDC